MRLSPINPSDLLYIRGKYIVSPQLPTVPGFEGVGQVEAAGPGLLGRILVGRRVAVVNQKAGNWREWTVVPARQAIAVPRGVADEQAATFFVNPTTAFAMTRLVLAVPRGEWLLQTAAGSALGRMVASLGKYFGFHTINVVRREEQAEQLRRAGMGIVLAFDPEHDPVDKLQSELGRVAGPVKYAIDPVGGATGAAVAAVLGKNGRMLTFGSLSNAPLSLDPRRMIQAGSCIQGFSLGDWLTEQSLMQRLSVIRSVMRLVQSGVLHTFVEQTYPLDRIAEAVEHAARPGRDGKILLQLSPAEK